MLSSVFSFPFFFCFVNAFLCSLYSLLALFVAVRRMDALSDVRRVSSQIRGFTIWLLNRAVAIIVVRHSAFGLNKSCKTIIPPSTPPPRCGTRAQYDDTTTDADEIKRNALVLTNTANFPSKPSKTNRASTCANPKTSHRGATHPCTCPPLYFLPPKHFSYHPPYRNLILTGGHTEYPDNPSARIW